MATQTARHGADLVVRPMTRPELDVAVEWAADEGWNPGLKDADCFHRTDPDGFLMGFRDGEPVASISVVRHDGAFGFLGFGVIRFCRTGHKIGPLFARSEADADVLFRALAAVVQSGPIFLDVPEPNRAAVKLWGRYGFTPVFETARMYRGPQPSLPLDRIYGITTFELG